MKEDAESVWELAVNEPEIDLKEAVENMLPHERRELKRNCARVLNAIRAIEIWEELVKDVK